MMLTVDEYMAFRRLIDSERESEGATLVNNQETSSQGATKKRSTAYSRKYKKAFKSVSSRYKLKSGKWKKGGFKRAVKEAHKEAKK